MSELQRQAAEHAIATVASKATYTGAATTGAGWALSNEFIALGGFVLAVLGFVINLYFKIKDDRRQQAAHEATMLEIKNRPAVMETAVSRMKLSEGYGGFAPSAPAPAEKQTDEASK